MKKVLIYSSLLVLISSCGNNSNTINQNSSKVVSSLENEDVQDLSENTPPEEASDLSTKEEKCSIFEMNAYLNDPDNSGTNIRKSPNGKVVLQIEKDDRNFEFFLTLTDVKDGWFKVKSPIGSIDNEFKIPNGEGWIHGSVVSVDTRNYALDEIKVLDNPTNGNVVGVFKKVTYGLKLLDICGEWVKIEHKGVIGWMEKEWICGNPLTNCS